MWLWRWRRNPLRRGSDVVEAWVVLAAWVLAVVGGILVGLVAQGAVERDLGRQRVERRAVTAVLVEDARDKVAPAAAAGDERVWAKARWAAPDGSRQTGLVKVRPKDAPAGARVAVWTDQRGMVVSKPVTPEEARLQAVLSGVLCAMVTAGAVTGGAFAVRAGLDRWRRGQWDAEWARVDTRWGGKTG
ncbi:Rv1733c family protein [Streptomyces sp. NBC_01352]|uniref:Rv1733c family protein n=1 Tax=Streptomyces sp. NBC_01352 TaxID=2903834 RepID=UPI003FCE9FC0